jgi:hypothetical protein
MSVEVLENVSQPEAARAAARSRAYATFAEAFEYPDAELYEAVRSGAFSRALRDVLAAVHPSLVDDLDAAALSEAGEADDLAVEFTRLFDVGASGPPCPLYGGLYIGARMKTMEEAVRFYKSSCTSWPFARPRRSTRGVRPMTTAAPSGTSSPGTPVAGSPSS